MTDPSSYADLNALPGPEANVRSGEELENHRPGNAYALGEVVNRLSVSSQIGFEKITSVHGDELYSIKDISQPYCLRLKTDKESEICFCRPMASLYDKLIEKLDALAESGGRGNKERLIAQIEANRATFFKVMKGKNTNARDFVGWLEKLGARVVFPGDEPSLPPTREVVFEMPKVVNVPNGTRLPDSSRYLAVPLVGAAGAGPWRDEPDEFTGDYLMVLRTHPAVRGRSDLIGVRVGRGETSMVGTLDPEDICIVDKGDIPADPHPPGNIFLVRDPYHGVAVKRVVLEREDSHVNIVFYSDNARENPPIVRDFQRYYESNLRNAIIGRVIVGFSDMTKK